MRIRTQLLLLVSGVTALFLVSIASYFAILSPLNAFESEVSKLSELSRATAALQIEANQLTSRPLGPQVKIFLAAVERLQKSQEGLKSIVLLTQASPELAAAVEAVKNLGELSAGGIGDLTSAVASIDDLIKQEGLDPETSNWSDLLRKAAAGELTQAGGALFALIGLQSALQPLNDSLSMTRLVVEKKDAEVSAGVTDLKAKGTTVGASIVAVSILAALLLSTLLARRISRSLKKVGLTVLEISRGDLRLRLDQSAHDELGTLGRDLNDLLSNLASTFRRIQSFSTENLAVREQLVSVVSSATSTAIEIESNSSSILTQLKRADERIRSSEGDLSEVLGLWTCPDLMDTVISL